MLNELWEYKLLIKQLTDELEKEREELLKKGKMWALSTAYNNAYTCLKKEERIANKAIYLEAVRLANKYLNKDDIEI